MLASSTPVYFQQPFANNAGVGYTRAIPNTTADTTAASLNLGFPPACFVDVSLGGTPPNGMDFNGIFNEITANIQWTQAGGFAAYSSAFSTAIGGYPNGAILAMANGKGLWRSTADNNVTNPDTSGAGWVVESIAPGAYLDLSVAGGTDVTLTSVQAANNIIDLGGLLTGNINVIVPTASGSWVFTNNTTGAFTLTVKTAAGTGITIPQGYSVLLYCDGVSVYLANRAGTTVAQFDNSAAWSTTAFVQRALGSLSGFTSISASTALTNANAGQLIQFSGATSAQTITLPALSGLTTVNGVGFWIENAGSVPVTVKGSGTDQVAGIGVGGFTLQPNETCMLFNQSTVQWALFGNPSALMFGSSLAASGYQKLPSGLIIQWGAFTTSAGGYSNITFPIAFPTMMQSITGNVDASTAVIYGVDFNNSAKTTTTIPVAAVTTASAYVVAGIRWIAIGY